MTLGAMILIVIASSLMLYGFGWGLGTAIITALDYFKNNQTRYKAISLIALGLWCAFSSMYGALRVLQLMFT